MDNTKPPGYWEKVLMSGANFVWIGSCELFNGIKHDRVDLNRYVYPGIAVAVVFVTRCDLLLTSLMGFQKLALSYKAREIAVYTGLLSGWLIWAGKRAFDRTRLLHRLRDAFLYCSLKAHNRLPAFIDDTPIDDHVRSLRLYTQGIPLQSFIEKKGALESTLNISIVKMREEQGDKGRINILYATAPLSTRSSIENLEAFKNGEIPIGVSYEGPIKVNLKDIAHLLVAGQTGGGKSNFEKLISMVLVTNNPEADVFYLDFKGGMELASLKEKLGDHHSNFHSHEGPRACTKFLGELGDKIEGRLVEIAKSGAANLDDYLVKRLAVKPNAGLDNDGIERPKDILKRTYIVVDEIAQLYVRDPSLAREDLVRARDAVNRIARQGRAAGIHLIVATQKPDAQSFDQTVKANLPAVLCFPMNSTASSVSALGTKRAFDLDPEIKGRAVWKYGPKTTEVQTYLFE